MADVCDMASEAEAQFLTAARSRAGTSKGPGPVWIDGAPCCRKCGGEIPARRVESVPDSGLCIDCAE